MGKPNSEWSVSSDEGAGVLARKFKKLELVPKLPSAWRIIRQLVPPTILKLPRISWQSHKAKFMFDLKPNEVERLRAQDECDIAVQFLQLSTPEGPTMEFNGKAVIDMNGKTYDLDMARAPDKARYLKWIIMKQFRKNPVKIRLNCYMSFDVGTLHVDTLPTVVAIINLIERRSSPSRPRRRSSPPQSCRPTRSENTAKSRENRARQLLANDRQPGTNTATSARKRESSSKGGSSNPRARPSDRNTTARTNLTSGAPPSASGHGAQSTDTKQTTSSSKKRARSPSMLKNNSRGELFSEIIGRRKISKDTTLTRVRDIIREDYEMTGLKYLRVDVKCQLTTARIMHPARYRKCTHVQCFELDAFLKMVKTSSKFSYEKCPVCQNDVQFKDLAVDQLFDDFLHNEDKNGVLDESCAFVRIYKDGTWEWDAKKLKTNEKEIMDIDLDDDEDDIKILKESINMNSAARTANYEKAGNTSTIKQEPTSDPTHVGVLESPASPESPDSDYDPWAEPDLVILNDFVDQSFDNTTKDDNNNQDMKYQTRQAYGQSWQAAGTSKKDRAEQSTQKEDAQKNKLDFIAKVIERSAEQRKKMLASRNIEPRTRTPTPPSNQRQPPPAAYHGSGKRKALLPTPSQPPYREYTPPTHHTRFPNTHAQWQPMTHCRPTTYVSQMNINFGNACSWNQTQNSVPQQIRLIRHPAQQPQTQWCTQAQRQTPGRWETSPSWNRLRHLENLQWPAQSTRLYTPFSNSNNR